MNELEQDLRTLLADKAADAGVPTPDARLLRRARRRQVSTALAGALAVAALVGGVVLVMWAFGPSRDRTPADQPEPLVETTVNGVTVTHPESWDVVDPVDAGLAPETQTPTDLIVLMTNAGEVTPEAISCPGNSGGGGDGLVMTIQEVPVGTAGGATIPWPVDLAPLIEPGQDEVGSSGCFPGWTFLRGSWSAAQRGFEARVGFGPNTSIEQRDALEAAFQSLRFAPAKGTPDSAVVASGTAAGQEWKLVAETNEGFFQLRLESDGNGAAMAFPDESPGVEGPEFGVGTIGVGADLEIVVFGAAMPPIVRVEAVPMGGGSPVSTDIVDVPDAIGGSRDAFVLSYRPSPFPNQGATIAAYDAAGGVVATQKVTLGAPRVSDAVEVGSGTDWTVWVGRQTGLCIEVTTAMIGTVEPTGGLACPDPSPDEIGTAEVFALPEGRAVAYGFLGVEAERVLIQLEDGSTLQASAVALPSDVTSDLKAFAVELAGSEGAGRISVLGGGGHELGHADFAWTPRGGGGVRLTPTTGASSG